MMEDQLENEDRLQPSVQYTEDNIRHLSDMEHVRTRDRKSVV